jgi:hypothetical protein
MENKKADVIEYPGVFNHVGLLVNKPPGRAGCRSTSLPMNSLRKINILNPSRVGI